MGQHELSVGNIDDGKDEYINGSRIIPLTESYTECDTCVFFPKCAGGCDATRRDGYLPCGFQKYLVMYHVLKLIKQDRGF